MVYGIMAFFTGFQGETNFSLHPFVPFTHLYKAQYKQSMLHGVLPKKFCRIFGKMFIKAKGRFAIMRFDYFRSIGISLEEKRLLLVFICICSVFGAFITEGGNAQASTNACNLANCTYRLQFDGAQRTANGWGASALIGAYQVNYLCLSSSVWSMVDDQTSQGFAQSGYLRLSNWSTNTTYYFYEFADTNYAYDPVMLGVLSKNWGGGDTFTDYYDSGSRQYRMQINNVDMADVSLGWNTDDQQWYAETHSDADHVVGGYNHHSQFRGVSYLLSGRWYYINAPGQMYNNTAYGSYSASGSGFFVWDTRVS